MYKGLSSDRLVSINLYKQKNDIKRRHQWSLYCKVMLSHLLLATLGQKKNSPSHSQFFFMLISFDWRGSSFSQLVPICLFLYTSAQMGRKTSCCFSLYLLFSRGGKKYRFISDEIFPVLWNSHALRFHLQSKDLNICHRNGAGGVKEVVEKRRSHNDNDPGHVFLRWDIRSFVWTTIKIEPQCRRQN